MFKIVEFFNQVCKEGCKVSWATRPEVLASTAMVLVVVSIASIFFLVVDMAVYNLIQYSLEFGR